MSSIVETTEPTSAPAVNVEANPDQALGARLFEQTLCLSLSISRFGDTRKVRNLGAVTVAADKSLLGMNKKLLRSDKYQAISRLADEIRSHIRDIALPSATMKAGMYLIPMGMVQTVETYLQSKLPAFEAAVAEFIAEYPDLVRDMEEPLGVLYDPRNYPPAEQVRAKFELGWRFVGYDTPARLRSVSMALWQAEQEKAAAAWESDGAIIRDAMREAAAGLIEHTVEKLKPTEDGKKKRLHETTVEKLTTFLDTFAARNVANDRELAALVERAREVMKGVDVEQMRSDDTLRARVLSSFETLKAEIEPMVVKRSARKITLEDADNDGGEE